MTNLKPERVFYYFKQISDVPRGSGNCKGIALYCRNFAINHNLKYVKDDANNVVIFKDGTPGYENSEPVILQGHTDMVCQKAENATTDFINRGIEFFVDGDFLKAKETTLGADNGIAVAMILAILESENIPHPPIEAVFTSDEEIGLVGAGILDKTILKAKKLINLDSEEDDTVTVSCAGGCDLKVWAPLNAEIKSGTKITVSLKGLLGGHSGVEIHKGRANANKLAGDFFHLIADTESFDIISFNGGTKTNAIPNSCKIEFLAKDAESFCQKAEAALCRMKDFYKNEPDFSFTVETGENGSFSVISEETKRCIIHTASFVPDGVIEMSKKIEGLVETSVNLGIFETKETEIVLHFGLRSNKKSGLASLEKQLVSFFDSINWESKASGHYPPWEYTEVSQLKEIYKDVYEEYVGKVPKVEAIHAGLECGIFADAIEGIDCISIGPSLYDVHTVNEKLSISSTKTIFNILLKILEKLR